MELTVRSRKTRGGLGAVELAGEEGDRRRPSRKQMTRSVACGAPRARWRGVAEVEVVGASRGRASEARGGRWPRLWCSHGHGGARLRRGTKGSAVDLRGKAQGPRERAGASGRRDRGDEGVRSYPLLNAGEGVRRGRAPVPTLVRGTGKGSERSGERVGSAGWARWAGLAASWAVWSRGVLFLFFSFVFCFCIFFSFPFLFYLI